MNSGIYEIYYSCGLGMILNIEEDEKLFLQVTDRLLDFQTGYKS
jgi:hypothetical protein